MSETRPKLPAKWARPNEEEFKGDYVTLRRLRAESDADDLYAASHGSEATTRVWKYMAYGPFADRGAMQTWLHSVEAGEDPLYFTVFSNSEQKLAGIITIMSIVPDMGRAELGNIWYGPAFQKTAVNTEDGRQYRVRVPASPIPLRQPRVSARRMEVRQQQCRE